MTNTSSPCIFNSHAEAYFAKNLVVIPTRPNTKAPYIKGWQEFSMEPPSAGKQRELLNAFRGKPAGIALVLGTPLPCGNKLAFIDVDDPRVQRFTEALLGPVVCSRVGRKGAAFAVRLEPSCRSSQLKLHDGSGAVDILANKKMVILPPSIHPDTSQPYRWEGKPLLECDQMEHPVVLQKDVDLLQEVLKLPELPSILNGKHTHEATLKLTFLLVRHDMPTEQILKLVPTLFPANYAGNSLDELEGMINSAHTKLKEEQEQAIQEGEVEMFDILYKWAIKQDVYLDANQASYISVINNIK